ncbi:MAG: M2 family metallopeptidase, partial [Planctomycetes bacterium]|nr:M2 family metallopeptidase [Planctomycetota bacterium]
LVDLTVRTFEGLGLDVRTVVAQSDLFPREGKCEHAFCIDMDREGDVRVLANVEPSEGWMITMLHEFGHAAYDRYVSPDLPFLLKSPAHSLMTEAVAMLLSRLVRDPVWLTKVAGLPATRAGEIAAAVLRRERLEKLVMMRWMLVMCRFERALYADPGLSRNAFWWDLREWLQGLRRPEGRDAPDWAAKIHFAVSPVYYQNYLLGELVASQLEAWLRGMSPAGDLVENPAPRGAPWWPACPARAPCARGGARPATPPARTSTCRTSAARSRGRPPGRCPPRAGARKPVARAACRGNGSHRRDRPWPRQAADFSDLAGIRPGVSFSDGMKKTPGPGT